MPHAVRRCFVISPFGDPHSENPDDREASEIASKIKTEIVGAAVERMRQNYDIEIDCYRGDEDPSLVEISVKICQSIYRDHVIIAVVFRPNDNVSYEVGLAHAIGRSVILLKHVRFKAPFDIQGRPHIKFDEAALNHAGPERARVVHELCRQMYALLPANGAPAFSPNPFDKDAVPFGRCLAFDRFRISFEEWSRLFQETEQELWLAGNTLEQLFYKATFPWPDEPQPVPLADILAVLLLRGRDVHVLVMDESNIALDWKLLRFRLSRSSGTQDERSRELRGRVAKVENLVRRIARQVATHPDRPEGKRVGTLKFTKVQHGVIKHRVTMSERRAFVTPMFYSLHINTGPAFEAYPKSESEHPRGDEYSKIALYKAVRDDLLLLQQLNPTYVMRPDGSTEDPLASPVGPTGEAAEGFAQGEPRLKQFGEPLIPRPEPPSSESGGPKLQDPPDAEMPDRER